MSKESTQAQSVKNVRSVKPKKRLTKRAVSVSSKKVKKAVKVKKEPKETKAKVFKPLTNRKINNKPVLAKTTGINISPAKVKNIVANFVLNKDAYAALKELKNAMPRKITKVVDGKNVVEDFKGTPLSQLSQSTRDYIKYATSCHESSLKEDFVKQKITSMQPDAKKKYLSAKNSAKDTFDKEEKLKFLSDSESFDVEAFNISYDPNFYKDFKVPSSTDSELKTAINKVTKLKNRFSTNARVYLSALVEYLIKQLAINGTVCCVADNKKIIQLSHILDTSKPGFAERFPLYPLIVNLDTFKQAQSYIYEQSQPKAKPEESNEEGDDEETDSKTEKTTDLFHLDELALDKQYQFRYYIGESCREVRMDLAKSETDEAGELMTVYNYTSVSKLLKNFCSTLVCEFLIRIGHMLEKEIETRGIKTVNDTVIRTVISHYHIVSGVPEKDTLDFIRKATTKYYSYVADRQQKRKDQKKDEGDLPYAEK